MALLGTAPSPQHLRLLARAGRAVLHFDGDRAGAKAARHTLAELAHATTVHVATLPEGADPDDLGDQGLVQLLGPLFLS